MGNIHGFAEFVFSNAESRFLELNLIIGEMHDEPNFWFAPLNITTETLKIRLRFSWMLHWIHFFHVIFSRYYFTDIKTADNIINKCNEVQSQSQDNGAFISGQHILICSRSN